MNIRPDFGAIRRTAAEILDLLEDDPTDQAFLDTLDGATDAMDVADVIISRALQASAMVTAIKAQENDLAARRKRYEAREEACRGLMLQLVDAIGVKKLERPAATISRRSGSVSCVITDETAVPSQLCKTVTTPDKAAIKAQLLAGETVPGAALVTGDDGVTVRVK